eukprot:CAMPEP_0185432460 /NCGR_PEP_ID=MMETSP1365-20130426/18763_1 /TAXON_ID=38817 /ORGANISM="Gephyrocapsa oceanica, Strain RCC1303" /LENGTH=313 /DNA_ID=CAMNT_0028036829 /DNA_START=217 /DNA_END=1160 /DNA_ORIENTATION=-
MVTCCAALRATRRTHRCHPTAHRSHKSSLSAPPDTRTRFPRPASPRAGRVGKAHPRDTSKDVQPRPNVRLAIHWEPVDIKEAHLVCGPQGRNGLECLDEEASSLERTEKSKKRRQPLRAAFQEQVHFDEYLADGRRMPVPRLARNERPLLALHVSFEYVDVRVVERAHDAAEGVALHRQSAVCFRLLTAQAILWKEYSFSRKRGGGFEKGSKMWISHAGFVRRTPSSNAESAFEPNEYTMHGRPLCRISLTPHVHLPPSKLNSETKLVRSSVHGQSYTGANSDITAPSFKGLSWKRGVPPKFHVLVSVLVVQR